MDGEQLSLTYDGILKTIPDGTVAYTYDPTSGNLATVTSMDGEQLSLTYDGILKTSARWSGDVSGRIDIGYDENFLVVSRAINGGSEITRVYDDDALLAAAGDLSLARDPSTGAITGTTLGGLSDEIEYNGFGEVVSRVAAYGGAEVYSAELERDALGRIVTKTESMGGGPAVVTDYEYDLRGRLTTVTADSLSGSEFIDALPQA